MNKPLIKSLPIAAAIAAVVASAGAVRNRHRRLGRFRSLIEPPIQCATPVRRHAFAIGPLRPGFFWPHRV